MKEDLQNIEDERELESAKRYFAKNNLEAERPTRFFCSMNKRMKSRAQFEEIHVKEKNERGKEVTRIVKKQSSVEWEVRKYYWSLYRKEETFCNKKDILAGERHNNGRSQQHTQEYQEQCCSWCKWVHGVIL